MYVFFVLKTYSIGKKIIYCRADIGMKCAQDLKRNFQIQTAKQDIIYIHMFQLCLLVLVDVCTTVFIENLDHFFYIIYIIIML